MVYLPDESIRENRPVDLTFGPSFFIGVVFSLFGMAYFAYGKKQGNYAVLIAGVGLMFYPYFVSDAAIMTVTGIGILASPFVAARFR